MVKGNFGPRGRGAARWSACGHGRGRDLRWRERRRQQHGCHRRCRRRRHGGLGRRRHRRCPRGARPGGTRARGRRGMDGTALFGDFPGYRGHVSLDGDSAVRGDPGNGFVFAADDPWDTRPGTAEPTSLVGGPPAAGQTGRVCAHVLPGPGVTGAEDRRLLGLRGQGRGHRKVRGGAWWHVSAAEPALRGTGARPHRIPIVPSTTMPREVRRTERLPDQERPPVSVETLIVPKDRSHTRRPNSVGRK
jgi:hypothetical protein